jgi:small-conductance mechanosensitive channel
MNADAIDRMQRRDAYAAGARDFGRHFGHVLAALVLGFLQGLFAAWVLWLFWFAAVETWTVLVSPAFIAGAELVAICALSWAWRLLAQRGADTRAEDPGQ